MPDDITAEFRDAMMQSWHQGVIVGLDMAAGLAARLPSPLDVNLLRATLEAAKEEVRESGEG